MSSEKSKQALLYFLINQKMENSLNKYQVVSFSKYLLQTSSLSLSHKFFSDFSAYKYNGILFVFIFFQ